MEDGACIPWWSSLSPASARFLMTPVPAAFRLAVMTPGGKDGRQVFPDGAGTMASPGHAPVNFHAYAACTHGVYWSGDSLPDEPHVLLLIGSKMERAEVLLRRLKDAGKTVVITIKETGLPQIAGHFQNFANWSSFKRLCALADGALATTFDTEPLYLAANPKLPVAFIPPPYPVEEAAWDVSKQISQPQRGIFLGTRQMFVASRNHALALALLAPVAEAMNEPITVISGRASDLPPMKRLINKMADFSLRWHQSFAAQSASIQIITRQLRAVDYLKLMAAHKLVFQLDQSSVPGQVAGDALMCRLPCVGGNGTAERLVFPDLCGHGRSTGELLEITRRLLSDDGYRAEQVQRSVTLAQEKMSFSSVRKQLETFFQSPAA